MRRIAPILALALLPATALADPSMECPGGSQIEIGACVSAMLVGVDGAVEQALGFARDSAVELDRVTGRAVALPALEASQAAWAAYRDAQCDLVGAGFGGGTGTGIAITGCRVEMGRARVAELLDAAR